LGKKRKGKNLEVGLDSWKGKRTRKHNENRKNHGPLNVSNYPPREEKGRDLRTSPDVEQHPRLKKLNLWIQGSTDQKIRGIGRREAAKKREGEHRNGKRRSRVSEDCCTSKEHPGRERTADQVPGKTVPKKKTKNP